MKNEWVKQNEQVIINSPVMRMIQRDCVSSEDGRRHRFFLLESSDWCNIIPVTPDGRVVFVKQFRIGINAHTLEIPGGVVDSGDPDLETSALREMTEETGYVATPESKVRYLGWSYPNPAIQNNRVHSFIVTHVRKEREQALDPGEMIEVVELPIPDVTRAILDGRINHALILNGFFSLLLRTEEVPELLERLLSGQHTGLYKKA